MPRPAPVVVRVPAPSPWPALRAELELPAQFPADALAEAQSAADRPLDRAGRTDLTGEPFFTVDPPGSRDLDQAMRLARLDGGYRVRYAIADVAAFVAPGGAVDQEAQRRGETAYFPDLRVPLHPPRLAEDAASLLPEVPRPAVVWTLDLDGDGRLTATRLERAVVRSRRQWTYEQVEQSSGEQADGQLGLLAEIGRARQALAAQRGAVQLATPEQQVTAGPDGRPCLRYRAPLASEGWNAEISLLTGIAAARLMVAGGVGLLRTLPPPDPEEVAGLRRSALALGVDWPADRSYGQVLSRLDPARAPEAAVLTLATRLLRGAGYQVLPVGPGEAPVHSAVGSVYAHCTAPLRRLADRYVTEVCLALHEGVPVPGWVAAALPQLPERMAAADRRAHEIDRAVVDLAEALVLAPRVGESFAAVVVTAGAEGGTVQLADPAVRAPCDGAALPVGQSVRVRLVQADPERRSVRFGYLPDVAAVGDS